MTKSSILLFSFIAAFNALILEFLMATFVTNILSGEIFLYPFVIILYLFGMGVGANYINKRSVTNEISLLSKIEIQLCILIWVGFILLNIAAQEAPVLFLPLVTLLCLVQGFLIGQEIPLIFSLCRKFKLETERKVLALDYFASFLATIIFVFVIYPHVNLYHAFWALSCFCMCSVLFIDQNQRNYLFVIIATVVTPMIFPLEQYHQFRYNLQENEKIISLFKTEYQEVTLIAHDLKKKNTDFTESSVLNAPDDYAVRAYLNNIYQFQVNLNYPHDQYHYEMVNPVMKSFPQIKKVLILGGGDGLPAKELLKYKQITNIDLVDIDRKWVEFSKTNPLMKIVNNNSLNDPRVNVIIGNAFAKIKDLKHRYDLIILDFPEGESLESLRIHSDDYTKQLKSVLTQNGIILSQEDTFTDEESVNLIVNTLLNNNLETIHGTYHRGQDYLIQFISFVDSKDLDIFVKNNKSKKIKYFKKSLTQDGIITYRNPKIIQSRIKSFIKEIFTGLIK